MQKVGFIMEEHWYDFITRPTSMDSKGSMRDLHIKSPDASVMSFGTTFPNFIIEVAFSETHEHARRKVDIWLESLGLCRVVILVIINEITNPRRGMVEVENEIPEDNYDDADDDAWLGDLRITVEAVRNGREGTYTHQIVGAP